MVLVIEAKPTVIDPEHVVAALEVTRHEQTILTSQYLRSLSRPGGTTSGAALAAASLLNRLHSSRLPGE
jgi:hypothetical protein